ncbi:alkaline phosphatase family protein [bacterium]|nr:alkaline phosphatase family protein [bacterium]
MFFRKKNNRNKVVVVSLDGVPYTFLEKMINEEVMPNLKNLLNYGEIRRTHSVIPPISSVAWSSFMTGKNPGKHGIFGFVDRKPNPLEMYIQTGVNLKAQTLWEYLSEKGKQVIVMNVPETYPPRKVNGLLISGFLASEIENAVYPKNEAKKLKEMGYVIDVDAGKAKDKKDEMMNDLLHILDKRVEISCGLLENRKWDFCIFHIMETDRINHFFWLDYENDGKFKEEFIQFYREIDNSIMKFIDKLDDSVNLILMSDHGFCGIKKEVNLNHILHEKGLIVYKNENPNSLRDLSPETKAYSMIPGRFYVNLKGREESGTVEQGEQYDKILNEITHHLNELEDPDTGSKIIDKVHLNSEVYQGEYAKDGPDLVALPHNGYDLKAKLGSNTLFGSSYRQGMHTYDDAFMYVRNHQFNDLHPAYVYDGFATILKLMDLPFPEDIDSRVIIKGDK